MSRFHDNRDDLSQIHWNRCNLCSCFHRIDQRTDQNKRIDIRGVNLINDEELFQSIRYGLYNMAMLFGP